MEVSADVIEEFRELGREILSLELLDESVVPIAGLVAGFPFCMLAFQGGKQALHIARRGEHPGPGLSEEIAGVAFRQSCHHRSAGGHVFIRLAGYESRLHARRHLVHRQEQQVGTAHEAQALGVAQVAGADEELLGR